MDAPSCTAVFFDVGDTLAFVRGSADGDCIDELAVYPGVDRVLKSLPEGVRLGVLADPGRVPAERVRAALYAALERSGISSLFDESLVVFAPKASPRGFREAAARVAGGEGCPRPTLLYVGADASERARAIAAGFLTAPHPVLAPSVLRRRGPLRYLCIRVPPAAEDEDWRAVLREQPLAPLHLAVEPGGVVAVYGVADTATAAALDDLGFRVDRLGAADEPQTSELYLLRDDLQVERGFLDPVGNSASLFAAEPAASRVLASTREGLLVALPAGESVERFRFHGTRHAHAHKLVPTIVLLKPAAGGEPAAAGSMDALSPEPLSDDERCTLACHVNEDFLDRVVRRYVVMGLNPDGSGVNSRHIHHPGNGHAVEALIDDLCLIAPGLLTVSRHCFTHGQRTLTNVVATLPATPGMEDKGVVVVSAHLDSTASEEESYCGSTFPAPGADDDASGVAGVLAAARACAALAAHRERRREMRFVLFNAEEHALAGSKEYAPAQSALGVKIVGVFQMDMIGYDRKPPPHFELHAGFPNTALPNAAEAAADSAHLAGLVERLRADLSCGLPPAQICTDIGDLAGGRSDHSSFHAAGYPACLATQDFFHGHGAGCDRNPDYHRTSDTTINAGYAADIARVVAAAAWVVATR